MTDEYKYSPFLQVCLKHYIHSATREYNVITLAASNTSSQDQHNDTLAIMDRPPAKKLKLNGGNIDTSAYGTKPSSKGKAVKKAAKQIDDTLIHTRLAAPEPQDSEDEEEVQGRKYPMLVFDPNLKSNTSSSPEASARLRGVRRPTMAREHKNIECTLSFF
ncbi:hypothetical protein LTR56_019584 [Elasticomyces elasticus]|nr:hypothetical protein LTR56_019584 [Elasticomyces elasticus]